MKIVFMGTPDFSRESLEKLYNDGLDIVAVVTTPDRPAGRGMKMVSSPVKDFAVEKGLKLFQPEKISKNDEFKDAIKALEPDLVVVVSYGIILPKSFLNIPKLGAINVHPSMLPKYRGPAPIQWAIINGDSSTGVTIMYLNEQMDAGDLIVQQEVEIDKDETTGDLWNRLSKIGADLLLDSVHKIEKGTAPRTVQPEEYTLAPMLDKTLSKIDWENKTALEIKNLIRGLNPIMGCYSVLDGKKIKLWKVDVVSKENFESYVQNNKALKPDEKYGKVLLANDKLGLFINANGGIISCIEVQGENAKKMDVKDFLRGNKIEAGSILE